ncbi:MAG TPA: hypothetical protein DEP50_08380, partial [Acinetobacter lwoffii]|nr:hypothetical protein [Acinetobacter lwoffii]
LKDQALSLVSFFLKSTENHKKYLKHPLIFTVSAKHHFFFLMLGLFFILLPHKKNRPSIHLDDSDLHH